MCIQEPMIYESTIVVILRQLGISQTIEKWTSTDFFLFVFFFFCSLELKTKDFYRTRQRTWNLWNSAKTQTSALKILRNAELRIKNEKKLWGSAWIIIPVANGKYDYIDKVQYKQNNGKYCKINNNPIKDFSLEIHVNGKKSIPLDTEHHIPKSLKHNRWAYIQHIFLCREFKCLYQEWRNIIFFFKKKKKPTLLLLEMQNALWEHNFMNSRTTSWFSMNSLLLCIMKSSCWGKTADYLVICHPFLTTHITASTYLLLTFEHNPNML